MDAVKIYENAVRRLEKSETTLGDFEKLIEPLRDVSVSGMPGELTCDGCKYEKNTLYDTCGYCCRGYDDYYEEKA